MVIWIMMAVIMMADAFYNAGIFTEPFRNMLPKYFFVVLNTW